MALVLMNALEKSKERLRNALERIETAISSGFAKMELEIQMLKEENAKLRQNSAGPAVKTTRKAQKAEATLELNDPVMTGSKTGNEVSLSLKELKKLVG